RPSGRPAGGPGRARSLAAWRAPAAAGNLRAAAPASPAPRLRPSSAGRGGGAGGPAIPGTGGGGGPKGALCGGDGGGGGGAGRAGGRFSSRRGVSGGRRVCYRGRRPGPRGATAGPPSSPVEDPMSKYPEVLCGGIIVADHVCSPLSHVPAPGQLVMADKMLLT